MNLAIYSENPINTRILPTNILSTVIGAAAEVANSKSGMCSVIFTDKGVLILKLIDPKAPEFSNMQPHTKELEQAFLKASKDRLDALKDKDEASIFALNPYNTYIPYADITGFQKSPFGALVSLKNMKQLSFTQVMERTNLDPVKNFIKNNVKGANPHMFVPRLGMLLKMLAVILAFILVFVVISFIQSR